MDVTLTNETRAAIGGIVGMLSAEDAGQPTQSGTISNSTMEGTIDATLPSKTIADAQTGAFGIGGVVGGGYWGRSLMTHNISIE